MEKIELSEEIEEKHLEYFKKNIVPNFNYEIDFSNVTLEEINRVFGIQIKDNKNAEISKIKEYHNIFIEHCRKHADNLAIGKPDKLRELVDNIKKEHNDVYRMIEKGLRLNTGKHKKDTYAQNLLKIFGYNTFSSKRMKEIKGNVTVSNFNLKNNDNWNPYTFVLMSNVRVCPYCNRQYITPVYSYNGKLRADLDHFYPKIKYPYLSMSLYNLVPCCKFCNSSLKGQSEFVINDINPYEDSYDEYFKFSTNPLNFDIQVDLTKKGKEKINSENKCSVDEYLNTFKIRQLYSYHTNQAEELMEKRIVYSDSYIKELYDNNKDLFKSENEIRQLVVGYIEDKSKINDEAFLKLRRDIAEQLHFINDNQDDEQIAELKKILIKGVN